MTPKQSALAKARSQCEHKAGVAKHYDHLQCNSCGAVKPDAQWEMAASQWFLTLDDARFFDKHGRMPKRAVVR